ncbi:MAG: hypothetical protein KC414_07365, partial [Romboutsia sp.]|nr:hypothetical protein [Romboutsia sp.]
MTEYLDPPYDEGIKKTAYNVFLELDKKYNLQVICRFGFKKDNIQIVKTNRLYASMSVCEIISNFAPDTILYLPFQSSTFASYLRLKILRYYFKNAQLLLLALQPKPLKKWQRVLISNFKPDYAFTPSLTLHEFWNEKGILNDLVPLLTDFRVFRNVKKNPEKKKLREKYGVPLNA